MSEPAWVPLGPAAVLDVGPEVAYQEFTADVAVNATTEATATTIVTAPAFVADGSSQYLVEFFSANVEPPGTSSGLMLLALFLDGVSFGTFVTARSSGANAPQQTTRAARRITPAAGSRVFSVRGYVTGGTPPGNVRAGAGAPGVYVPGFIRITKVPSAVQAPGGLVPPTAIGVALPASPVDGQEFILTDSLTAPTFTWRLRYVAAKASNKWVFVGGAPAVSQIAGAAETTGSTTPVDLATVGPSIVIPVAGDYFVEWGSGNDGTQAIIASMSVLGIAANLGVTAAGQGTAVAKGWRFSLAVGALTAKYNTSVAGQLAYFSNRYMAVTPVAVGG